MAQQRLGIIMNGVTGRMGMNQHLIRSIVAIRAQGGVTLRNGDTVMPDPILVGRNEAKLAQLAKANGVTRWTTDLNAALKNPEDTLFFDAATTKLRAKLLRKAIAAGKDIYCEKPTAENLKDALEVAQAAKKAGVPCELITTTSDYPADTILATAKKKKCDLIVMATHGRRGIGGVPVVFQQFHAGG